MLSVAKFHFTVLWPRSALSASSLCTEITKWAEKQVIGNRAAQPSKLWLISCCVETACVKSLTSHAISTIITCMEAHYLQFRCEWGNIWTATTASKAESHYYVSFWSNSCSAHRTQKFYQLLLNFESRVSIKKSLHATGDKILESL